MTLQQLEYIVALDNFRHFVTAAEQCTVAQPTLTMQVKKLEDEIGLKLFDRDKKPLKPTHAGEPFIAKARQILREVKELKAYVSDETESLAGEFTMGIIPTVAPYLLPLFLPEFMKAHPQIRLKIKELQTEQIIDALKKGTLDMGILATPLHVNAIREVSLFYEPFLLYLPEGHSLTHEEEISNNLLQSNHMLFLEEGHCFREQALKLCKTNRNKFEKGFDYESGSIEALINLVKRGIGYTMVPELSVSDILDSPQVKRFTEPEPVREISIAVSNSFTKEALIEHMHASITQAIPERFRTKRLFTRVKWR